MSLEGLSMVSNPIPPHSTWPSLFIPTLTITHTSILVYNQTMRIPTMLTLGITLVAPPVSACATAHIATIYPSGMSQAALQHQGLL